MDGRTQDARRHTPLAPLYTSTWDEVAAEHTAPTSGTETDVDGDGWAKGSEVDTLLPPGHVGRRYGVTTPDLRTCRSLPHPQDLPSLSGPNLRTETEKIGIPDPWTGRWTFGHFTRSSVRDRVLIIINDS